MRFTGFSDPALNLGYIDLQLATATTLDLFCCDTCKFTAPEMVYCDCNHIFCRNCLLALEDANHQEDVATAHCVLCEGSVSCMGVTLQEAFVAQLQFICPHCKQIVRLSGLKAHLRVCISPDPLQSTSPPSPKALVKFTPSSEHDSWSLSVSLEASEETMPESEELSDNQESPSTSSTDAPVTTHVLNAVRREVIDVMSRYDSTLRAELDALRHQLAERDGSQLMQRGHQNGEIFLLAFRAPQICCKNVGYTTSTITVASTAFFFKSHDTTKSYESYRNDVSMVVAGVDGDQPTSVFQVSISCRCDDRWLAPVTNTVESASIGKWVEFKQVFTSGIYEGALIRVQIKSKQ